MTNYSTRALTGQTAIVIGLLGYSLIPLQDDGVDGDVITMVFQNQSA